MLLQTLKSLLTTPPPPFEPEWITLLEQNLPLYSRLPDDLRLRLHDRIAQFLATIRFEGCAGLELTDEMLLTVAAQACLLVMHRDGRPYPRLKVVYLYPTTFTSVQKHTDHLGIVTEGEVARLGESWERGTVVLAWDSVEHGARNIHDAKNVTFHEFAHQLDHEDGATDGAPGLPCRDSYRSWARVFQENYDDFLQQIEAGRKTLLDTYGATNPAEFFAVATETFFEKPRQLARKMPDLYEEMRQYYSLDPREYFNPRPGQSQRT